MSIHELSFLLAAIITAALAIAMLIRGGRNRLYLSFSTLNGTLFAYYLAAFIHSISEVGFWFRIEVLAALSLPPLAIRFFTIFLGHSGGFAAKAVRASLTVSLLLSPFVLSDLINRYLIQLIVLTFVLAALVFCMLMIFERLRLTTSRVESARLRYLLYGGIVAVLLSMSGFVPRVEINWFPALGNTIAVVYMYFLSQIIIQYRLLDLNELVGKMLVLATLVTVLAAIYTTVGFFVTDIPGLIFFNTVIAGFVVLILFDPVTRVIENQVNRLLFRERYEFGRQLGMLRRELANVVDVSQMTQLVLTRLENSRRATGASIYLLEEETASLRCLGYTGPPPPDSIDAVAERPFLERLIEANALVIENIRADIREAMTSGDEVNATERDLHRETLRVLDVLKADLCFSLASENRIIGMLNVRDDRMAESYSPEEIAHLAAIANQAAICVENSRIVKRIRDRDRLAAVGEMAAGLAHEVRNPLGAIKGAAQMLIDDEDESSDPTAKEFIEIIVDEVNRLNTVVSAFLDYAKPYDGAAGPTSINQVAERVATLLGGTVADADIELKLELGNNLPSVRIDPEVLRQVLWNLTLNAIEAMESSDEKRLTITTREGSRVAPLHKGYFGHEAVELTVTDTGGGIPAADLERIFIPFYTTKAKGTGLGLAICQRLIRASSGTINASSTEGKGSTFTIRLPIWTDEVVTASAERLRPLTTEAEPQT